MEIPKTIHRSHPLPTDAVQTPSRYRHREMIYNLIPRVASQIEHLTLNTSRSYTIMRRFGTFPDCRILALSWDDADTQALLQVLDSQEVQATFFVVGEWAQRCPESVKALHDAGHEIMNHSATHPHLSQCSRDALIDQVTKGNELISALTGETPTLFRCPYGEYNDQIITTVRSLGMTPVQWDVDALE